MKMKFSARIAAYVVVLFLVASVGFFYLAYNMLDRSVKKYLDDNLINTNKQVLDMIRVAGQTSITQHLRTISDSNLNMVHSQYNEYLAGKITESEAKERAFKNFASQKIGETGYVYVVNSRGNVIFHPDSKVRGANLLQYDFIKDQIAQKTGMISYSWKNSNEEMPREKVLYMSYFDKWDWIISASTYKSEFNRLIKIGDFQNEIAGVKIGKSGYISVIDSKGNFIVHPFYQGKNVSSLDQNSQAVIARIIAEKNGMFEYNWKNTWDNQTRPKRAAFKYIEAYDWYVVSNYYQDELYGPFQNMMNLFLAIVFFGAFIMAFFIVAVVRRQAKPLGELVTAFQNGAKGDLAVRLTGIKRDEFGDLSTYFNEFMESLENMKERLEDENHIRKENEKRLRSLIDTTSEGYVQMTAGGYIMDVNDTFCDILRREKDELMGQMLDDFIQGPSYYVFESQMQLVRNGERSKFELRMANNEDRYYLVSASPVLNVQAAVTGAFALFTDITELKKALEEGETLLHKYQELNNSLEDKIDERTREMTVYIEELKRTQEQLLQSEKLSSLGLMISGIANELNTPLGNSITMSSFLEAQSRDLQQREAKHSECQDFALNVTAASGMILENLKKASHVLDTLKHIYPEQMKGMKEVFELSAVIEDAYEIFKKQFRLGSHKIEIECERTLKLHSYPKLVKQMLINLISNSLIHGFKGGYPGVVRIKVIQTMDEIHIEYSDDGEGIPFGAKDKIFEPFFKLDGESSNLGLGLYTVYNIVTLTLRGTIEWNSTPGMGTRFLIKLPNAALNKKG